ncbi:unnamed protein product [Orchesella dallaii]|uniref:Uncharacterized protein n=1 Tax=Orchesella dallaii TaxID=48710 RepID=A0ABP1PKD7_9HEXA
MNRMFSIDLNTPTPSLSGIYTTKPNSHGTNGGELDHAKKFRIKPINNDTKIYDKYFHKRIAKPVSIIQLIFAIAILICQLSTTGLLIGPVTPSALSTSDRIGVGIWTTILTTLSVGATFWSLNKTNFSRLHASMLLHACSFVAYIVLEYLLLLTTIPHIQTRIDEIQHKLSEVATMTLESRRLLLTIDNNTDFTKKTQIQMQAELNRLYAALVLSIIMAVIGILQALMHFFMTAKTGRAICLGKTYFEGKMLRMQSLGCGWRRKSIRNETKGSFGDLPKLERSDALPPPPYESGYFHP